MINGTKFALRIDSRILYTDWSWCSTHPWLIMQNVWLAICSFLNFYIQFFPTHVPKKKNSLLVVSISLMYIVYIFMIKHGIQATSTKFLLSYQWCNQMMSLRYKHFYYCNMSNPNLTKLSQRFGLSWMDFDVPNYIWSSFHV